MAFTLGAFVADSTAAPLPDGMLFPAFVADTATYSTRYARLPTPSVDSTNTPYARLLPFVPGNAGATQYANVTPTGGAVASGNAPRSFLLNGSVVVDAAIYNISTTGGAAIGGAAAVSSASVLQFSRYPIGAAVIGGTATIGYSWAEYDGVGGVVMSGAATVTTAITVVVPVGTGTLATALKKPVAVLTADLGADSCVISAAVGVPTAAMTAYDLASASIVSSSNAITAALSGVLQLVGALDSGLPAMRGTLEAALVIQAALHGSLPKPAVELDSYAALIGVLEGRVPAAAAVIHARSTSTQAMVMVTNMLTKAVSFYNNHPYNSFAKIGDAYFAASAAGLFQIDVDPTVADGDFDSTTLHPISAAFSFGVLDFKIAEQKRIADCYVGMRSDGDMELNISVDEQAPFTYNIPTYGVTSLKARRANLGKGLRGKYWQLGVANINGGNFDFDTFNLTVTPTARRI